MAEENHAITNAEGWLQIIRDMVAAIGAAEESGDDEAIDNARDEAQQSALSVMVRDGWRVPGGEKGSATEYEILLTTGGPALRIVGELSEHGEPEGEPKLQWQDWGTPWTPFPLTQADAEAVSSFVAQFYFEEG
jgi:hypothetical protein